MATRSAFLYDKLPGRRADDLRRLAQQFAFSIEDMHGAFYAIDGEGEQHVMSIENVEKELESRESISFLLWGADAECLYCRVRFIGSIRAVELDLKGTEKKEREDLCSRLIKAALDERFLGLVFDPESMTEDYNWDDFFIREAALNRRTLAGRVPELLLIKSTLMDRVVGFAADSWGHGVVKLS